MVLANKSPRARVRVRTAKAHESKLCSELRNWVTRAISEAEKNKDFDKKTRFMRLLQEL